MGKSNENKNSTTGIKPAIKAAYEYIGKLGFYEKSLPYSSAMLPIIYYFYRNNNQEPRNNDDVYRWIWGTTLMKTFHYGVNTRLEGCRKVIDGFIDNNPNINEFPCKSLSEYFESKGIPFLIDEKTIALLISSRYKTTAALCLLQILYYQATGESCFNKDLHEDHIHPKAKFTRKITGKPGCGVDNYDGVSNLQLLKGADNQRKNDLSPYEWLQRKIYDELLDVSEKDKNEKRSKVIEQFYKSLFLTNYYEKYKNNEEELFKVLKDVKEETSYFVAFIEARKPELIATLKRKLIGCSLYSNPNIKEDAANPSVNADQNNQSTNE